MERETRGRKGAEPTPPADGGDGRGADQSADRELLDGWMQVMEGFRATQEALVSELAERHNLGEGAAGTLVRLLTAPDHRMPMTRLAQEARMSSGGFTKVADRLCTAGLARRTACEDDRRLTYLELTDQGKDTARAISGTLTQVLRTRVLTPLGRGGFGRLTTAMRKLRDVGEELDK